MTVGMTQYLADELKRIEDKKTLTLTRAELDALASAVVIGDLYLEDQQSDGTRGAGMRRHTLDRAWQKVLAHAKVLQ